MVHCNSQVCCCVTGRSHWIEFGSSWSSILEYIWNFLCSFDLCLSPPARSLQHGWFAGRKVWCQCEAQLYFTRKPEAGDMAGRDTVGAKEGDQENLSCLKDSQEWKPHCAVAVYQYKHIRRCIELFFVIGEVLEEWEHGRAICMECVV